MQKYAAIIISVLIITITIFVTGCSKNSESDIGSGPNELVDCLTVTKGVNSFEGDMTSDTESDGQSMSINMNMVLLGDQ